LDAHVFAAAVAALLLTPGPTNTLVALAGAAEGGRGAARAAGAECVAYAMSVGFIAFAAGPFIAGHPGLQKAIILAAGALVLVLAVRLWRAAGVPGGRTVTPRLVFATTLLNPKGLVFGLALLPAAGAAAMPLRYGVFLALVALSGAAWGLFGALAGARGGLPVLSRAGAIVLAIAGVSVLASA
jgi:threonine/homoserine/homoserine lactone efflux protein